MAGVAISEQRDGVDLTNLDEPLTPEADATKRDLVDYLDAVAEELNDRPRKTLGFMKPSEKIIELLDAA